MKKIIPALILAALVTSCALINPEQPPAVQFNYVMSATGQSGLVRVFNLNGNTILQFKDLVSVQPKVYRSDNSASLAYTVVGQYAVVAGQHPMLKIEANGMTVNALQLASVTGTLLAPARSTIQPDFPAAVQATNSAEVTQPTLEQLTHELQETRKELAAAKQGLASIQNVNIEPLIIPPPLDESRRTWTLSGQVTLKENIIAMAKTAGYDEVNWKASNPYMVRVTTAYPSLTFVDFLKKITEAVPSLEFKVSKTRRTVDVVDSRP